MSIAVAAVNDAPTAVNGTTSTNEDTAVTVTVAADVDGPTLTASCTSSAGGTVTPNGFGTVSFLPPARLQRNPHADLQCHRRDLHHCDVGDDHRGCRPVNDPPIAVADSSDVNEGESVVIDVLANDTDVDGGDLTVTDIAAVSPPGATAVVECGRHDRHLHPPAELHGCRVRSSTAPDDGVAHI